MPERSSEPGSLIRVAILSPSGAVRLGLQQMLVTDERLEVVLAGTSLVELPGALDQQVDVVILTAAAARDYEKWKNLPGAEQPAMLFLADDEIEQMTDLPFKSGQPWGILPADIEAEALTAAVRAISEGLAVAPPAWLSKRMIHNGELPAKEDEKSEALTPRESEVLQQLANGLTNKQIAYSLGISENTVKYHISSVYTKLGVMNRAEAVRVGMRRGWITL